MTGLDFGIYWGGGEGLLRIRAPHLFEHLRPPWCSFPLAYKIGVIFMRVQSVDTFRRSVGLTRLYSISYKVPFISNHAYRSFLPLLPWPDLENLEVIVWRIGLKLTDNFWDVSLSCYLAGQSSVCGGTKMYKKYVSGVEAKMETLSKLFLYLFKNTVWVHVFLTSFLTHGVELFKAMCQGLTVYSYIWWSETLQCFYLIFFFFSFF